MLHVVQYWWMFYIGTIIRPRTCIKWFLWGWNLFLPGTGPQVCTCCTSSSAISLFCVTWASRLTHEIHFSIVIPSAHHSVHLSITPLHLYKRGPVPRDQFSVFWLSICLSVCHTTVCQPVLEHCCLIVKCVDLALLEFLLTCISWKWQLLIGVVKKYCLKFVCLLRWIDLGNRL